MFYSMYATAYDPAAAGIFSVSPANSLALTSARIYETGVKQSVLGRQGGVDLVGLRHRAAQRVRTDQRHDVRPGRRSRHQGHRICRRRAAGRRPEALGQSCLDACALRQFRFHGDLPATRRRTSHRSSSMPARPIGSNHWRWPVEIGGSVRHVGPRYLFEDDATTMEAYTVADAYALVDIPKSVFPTVGSDADHISGAQPDEQGLRRVVRSGLSRPGLSRCAANLRSRRLVQMVTPIRHVEAAPRSYEMAASFKW